MYNLSIKILMLIFAMIIIDCTDCKPVNDEDRGSKFVLYFLL